MYECWKSSWDRLKDKLRDEIERLTKAKDLAGDMVEELDEAIGDRLAWQEEVRLLWESFKRRPGGKKGRLRISDQYAAQKAAVLVHDLLDAQLPGPASRRGLYLWGAKFMHVFGFMETWAGKEARELFGVWVNRGLEGFGIVDTPRSC